MVGAEQHRIHCPPRRSHHRGAAAVLHHRPPLLDDLRTSSRSCAHNTHLTPRRRGAPAVCPPPPPRAGGTAGILGTEEGTARPGSPSQQNPGLGGATSSTQRCRAYGGAALLSPTGMGDGGDVRGARSPVEQWEPPQPEQWRQQSQLCTRCSAGSPQSSPPSHHPAAPQPHRQTAPQPWHPVWESARGAACCAGLCCRRTDTQTALLCHRRGRGWGRPGDTGWAPWGCKGRSVLGCSSAAPTVTHRTPHMAVGQRSPPGHGCASVSPQLPEQHSLQAQQHSDSSHSHGVTQRSSRGKPRQGRAVGTQQWGTAPGHGQPHSSQHRGAAKGHCGPAEGG